MKNKNQRGFNKINKIWYAISLGFQLGFLVVISIGIFMFLGFYLDKHFHSSPLFLIAGIVVGIFAASYNIYNIVLPLIKK